MTYAIAHALITSKRTATRPLNTLRGLTLYGRSKPLTAPLTASSSTLKATLTLFTASAAILRPPVMLLWPLLALLQLH